MPLLTIQKWITAYKPLEDYVRANEADSTLTYYFGTPAEFQGNHSASPSLLAIEQYPQRSDLYDIHFHSPAMGPFLEKIPDTMTTGLDLSHYKDVAGFLHRGEDGVSEGQRGLWWDTRIWCKDAQARAEVLRRLSGVAEDVRRLEEVGTWSFLVLKGLKGLDDEVRVRVFERYKDLKALERHWQGDSLLEFWKESKDLVRSMEGRGYVPNGWGWLHREGVRSG
jgi:quinol monooxygenase YgiN